MINGLGFFQQGSVGNYICHEKTLFLFQRAADAWKEQDVMLQ